MWRQAQVAPAYGRWSLLERWHNRSRSVLVRVLDGGREVDSFSVTTGETLRAAIKPIYRYLPRHGGCLQMVGIEEKSLPAGLDRKHREVPLDNLVEALVFLAG